jgi:hypothetical protein
VSAPAGPVFIVGSSHAGKTPLRILLDPHPALALSRHVGWWTRQWGRLGDLRQPDQVEAAVRTLCADPDVARLDVDAEAVLAEVRRTGATTYPELFGAVHQVHARAVGRPGWGIQLKGLEARADEVLDAFPTGRMIHLVRGDDAGRRWRPRPPAGTVRHDASRSRPTGRAERLATQRTERYLAVRYEDLATDPVATLRAVCRFCQLEPTEEMLAAAERLGLDRGPAARRRRRPAEALQRAGAATRSLLHARTRTPRMGGRR